MVPTTLIRMATEGLACLSTVCLIWTVYGQYVKSYSYHTCMCVCVCVCVLARVRVCANANHICFEFLKSTIVLNLQII